MDYGKISDFLEKFRKIISTNEESDHIILSVIKERARVTLTRKDIKITGGTIVINGSPMQKGQILIYKKVLLEDIQKLLPQKIFTDIR